MRFLFNLIVFSFLFSLAKADPIHVPPSEAVIEILTDLNGVIERNADVVSLMNLYNFEKKFEEWDELDFVLFQNAIKKYIHEGEIERGIKYPNYLSGKVPFFISQLKEAQKRNQREIVAQGVLKDFQQKIYSIGRDFDNKGLNKESFQSLQELKKNAEEMDLHPGSDTDKLRQSILMQIAKLQGKEADYIAETQKTKYDQEIERLRAIEMEKQEHRMQLIRWGIIAIVAFLFFAFWWSKQQGVDEARSE